MTISESNFGFWSLISNYAGCIIISKSTWASFPPLWHFSAIHTRLQMQHTWRSRMKTSPRKGLGYGFASKWNCLRIQRIKVSKPRMRLVALMPKRFWVLKLASCTNQPSLYILPRVPPDTVFSRIQHMLLLKRSQELQYYSTLLSADNILQRSRCCSWKKRHTYADRPCTRTTAAPWFFLSHRIGPADPLCGFTDLE